MAKINVTLFHADWCGHCVSFMPEWKKLEAQFKNDPSVNLSAMESSDPKFSRDAKINGSQIQGFPTIRIKVGDKETEYNDERSKTALVGTIEELKGAAQAGGRRKAKKTKKTKTKTKSKGRQARAKKAKTSSKGKARKATKRKTKTKSKGRKVMKGGANMENMNEQQMRELLYHKIAKYEQKYNQLHKDLRDKGIL